MPSRLYSLQELAERLDATLIGGATRMAGRLVHPTAWHDHHDLALAMDKDLLPLLRPHRVEAAVVSADTAIEPGLLDACLVVRRPRVAMAILTNLFAPEPRFGSGIHASAVIDPSASIGPNVLIGPYCVIGPDAVIDEGAQVQSQVTVESGARIGARTVLRAGVRIGADCVIGADCLFHFNASIGSDGFSFVTKERGSVEAAKADGAITATNQSLLRIASLGTVIIGDAVEIGANTAIDRGTIAPTRIGARTKIDNHVQIGHNVQIGEDCMICGRVGIAGSTVIGDRVVIGGASGIADHVQIGDDAVLMAMSGVTGNIPPKQLYAGIPALPRAKALEILIHTNRLKSLFNNVEALTARVKRLEPDTKNG
ncbi:MAG: UDP-3-O-(3-hydroxymyristoyl)glucosamine N-acyltransferase [Alphaproteobacteria bacterium]